MSATICTNKKARFDYFIEETFEAGIALEGCEVKSLREGKANLKDSHAKFIKNELYLVNAHITPYKESDTFKHIDPTRSRKLLLHKREINKLRGKMEEKGLSLLPLKLYFKRGKVKVSLGLGKGKKLHDKRAVLKEKAIKKELKKDFKNLKT